MRLHDMRRGRRRGVMASVTALAMAVLTGNAPASAAPLCFARSGSIVGTPGPDVLRGTPGNDAILGLGGTT